MRVVIQRVKEARVLVAGKVVSQIGRGLVLLVGIRQGDTEAEARYLAEKCVNLRIFEDGAGKLNLSALDLGAEILVVSQFTLYGNCRRGRRPSFTEVAPVELAQELYSRFVGFLRQSGLKAKEGRFGERMLVEIANDGPVTLIVDSLG